MPMSKKAHHSKLSTVTLVALMFVLMIPVQFAVVVLANKFAPTIGIDLRTDALITPGNHTVRVGATLVQVKSVEHHDRRLVTVGTTELVRVAYVDRDECLRSVDTAKRTGVISGTAQVGLTDGSSVFATGSLIAQSRTDGADLYTFHGTAGDATEVSTVSASVADMSIDCDVFAMPSGSRRLTEQEMTESMHRHLLEVKNASLDYDHATPHPRCLVSHCFAGDQGCTDPAPEKHCMVWERAEGDSSSTTTRHCKKPLCKVALPGFDPHVRRKLAGGRPDACFSRGAAMACRRIVGSSGSAADAYDQCFEQSPRAELTAVMMTGEAVLMAELSGGDEVLAVASDGHLFFDRVVYNAHKANEALREEVVELGYAGGSLSVTRNHMLRIDGADAPARLAKVGSVLHTAHGKDVRVQRVTPRGMQSVINPVTASGRVIAVDKGGRVPVHALTVEEAYAPFLTADKNMLVNGLLPFFSLATYLFPAEGEAYAMLIETGGAVATWSPIGTWGAAIASEFLILPFLMVGWTAHHAFFSALPAAGAIATAAAAMLVKVKAANAAKARIAFGAQAS